MQEQLKLLGNYLQGVWIKKRYILIIAWIICPIGWLIVTMLPNQYTSEAKVYADTHSILQPLLRGIAIQVDPSQQLDLMAKTLLNSRNVEIIGKEIDANIIAKTPEEYDEILKRLKDDIKISAIDRNNLYTISFTGEDPIYAKNVVEAALNVFIESTLGNNRLDAESAQDVINEQISFYESRLINAEMKLAEFKREYVGFLPGSDKNYYSNLQTQKNELEQTELELKEALSQLEEANKQLVNEQVASANQIANVETEYDQRINAIEIRLDDLLFRFTQRHPDVIESKRQLEELKALKQDVMKDISIDDTLNDNLVYQNLKITANQINNQIASLEVRLDRHRNKILELQNKLDTVPEVEAMLTSLTRDYNITKDKYEELLSRGERASISQSVGNTSEPIKFKIIEPPSIPTKPSGPYRLLLLLAVLVVGFSAGIGISFFISQLSPVVTSINQLTRTTGVPIFGVVSATESSGLINTERRKIMAFGFMSLLLVVILIFSIVVNLTPTLLI